MKGRLYLYAMLIGAAIGLACAMIAVGGGLR